MRRGEGEKEHTCEAPQLPEEQQRAAQYTQYEPYREAASIPGGEHAISQPDRAPQLQEDSPARKPIQPLRPREAEEAEGGVALEEGGVGDDARGAARFEVKPAFGRHWCCAWYCVVIVGSLFSLRGRYRGVCEACEGRPVTLRCEQFVRIRE